MQATRRERCPGLAVSLALLVCAWTFAGVARGAPRLRVHAPSVLEARAERRSAGLLFRGTLTEEGGRPLAGRAVKVTVSQGSARAPAALAPCPEAHPRDVSFDASRPGVAEARTDSAGAFCVAASPTADTCAARLEWAGDLYVDPSRADVTADLSRRQVELQIQSEARADLSAEAFSVGATAVVVGDGPDTPARGLTLVLTRESGAELGRATTSATGRAVFTVAPARLLGAPGLGELRVDFTGDAATSPARRVASIERDAEVRLALVGGSDALEGEPEYGLTIPLRATLTTGDPAPVGVVEASCDGRPVGAAPVRQGLSDLVATFSDPGPSAALSVRYVSEVPWLRPGPELTLPVPAPAEHPLRNVPIAVAGVAVLFWLALGRVKRPPLATPTPKPAAPPPRVAEARVLERAVDPRTGWSGTVLDAHDAAAIDGAELTVERPAFGGVEVLARAKASPAGRFELRCDVARRGDELVVTAPLHATLRQGLPPSGRLEIGLVSRRRALVDRLVAWAGRRGGALAGPPEPTPGRVAHVARREPRTAAWAEAVDRAGFGPGVVDRSVEESVDRLAPPEGHGPVKAG